MFLNPINYMSWKVLLEYHLEMNGGENTCHFSKSGLNKIKKEFNLFCQNVISSWAFNSIYVRITLDGINLDDC